MKRLVSAVLAVAASAWGEPARVPLAKGFTPNPLLIAVQRAEGGAGALDPGLCKDAPSAAQLSKSPVAVLEVPEGISHLTLQATQGDRVVAGGACGTTKQLTLDVKPGPLEVFLVTPAAVPADARGKLRVFDADRPRVLPAAVKTVAFPLTLSGELGDGAVPDAQLEVATKLDGVTWKLDGAAREVWLSPLALEDVPAVKAGDSLAPGRYAVWIRGAKGAYTVSASVPQAAAAPPAPEPVAEAAPAPAAAESTDPLAVASKPEAGAPVEARVLTKHLPGLDPRALEGFSKEALALRQRAFTELPAEFLVFAAADGEVLLPLSFDGSEVSVISADGAVFSMPPAELALKPGNGAVLVRSQRTELVEKLSISELAPEKDARVKSLEKLKKQIQGCIDRHPDWPDAAKRCNASKVDKAESKLKSALKKAYAKKRAAELAAVAKRVKAAVAAREE